MAKKKQTIREPTVNEIMPIFLSRKLYELIVIIIIIITIIFIPTNVGKLICGDTVSEERGLGFCCMDVNENGNYSWFEYWFAGMIFISIGIGLIWFLGGIVTEWIKSNWEKSYNEVYEDLNGMGPED